MQEKSPYSVPAAEYEALVMIALQAANLLWEDKEPRPGYRRERLVNAILEYKHLRPDMIGNGPKFPAQYYVLTECNDDSGFYDLAYGPATYEECKAMFDEINARQNEPPAWIWNDEQFRANSSCVR